MTNNEKLVRRLRAVADQAALALTEHQREDLGKDCQVAKAAALGYLASALGIDSESNWLIAHHYWEKFCREHQREKS